MSRVGRRPVAIPDKVKVEQKDRFVLVTGPLGTVQEKMPFGVAVNIADGVVTLGRPKATRKNRGFQGLARALVANMVGGVTKGYERTLQISGVGYKAELKGDTLAFALGYTHPTELKLPKGISAELDKPGTTVKIKGVDKQMVGQIAARIRSFKVPEPYKAKGVKYAEETIKRKVGKTGAKA